MLAICKRTPTTHNFPDDAVKLFDPVPIATDVLDVPDHPLATFAALVADAAAADAELAAFVSDVDAEDALLAAFVADVDAADALFAAFVADVDAEDALPAAALACAVAATADAEADDA